MQENTSISMQWNSLIRTALNKTDDIRLHHKAELGESHQKVYPLKREGSFTSNSPHFECIISKQMVGIFITIWARSPLLPYIRHTSVSSVGCGIFGCLGNKVQIIHILISTRKQNILISQFLCPNALFLLVFG